MKSKELFYLFRGAVVAYIIIFLLSSIGFSVLCYMGQLCRSIFSPILSAIIFSIPFVIPGSIIGYVYGFIKFHRQIKIVQTSPLVGLKAPESVNHAIEKTSNKFEIYILGPILFLLLVISHQLKKDYFVFDYLYSGLLIFMVLYAIIRFIQIQKYLKKRGTDIFKEQKKQTDEYLNM